MEIRATAGSRTLLRSGQRDARPQDGEVSHKGACGKSVACRRDRRGRMPSLHEAGHGLT